MYDTEDLVVACPRSTAMETGMTRLIEASPAHPLGRPDVDILGRPLDALQGQHQHPELWQFDRLGADTAI